MARNVLRSYYTYYGIIYLYIYAHNRCVCFIRTLGNLHIIYESNKLFYYVLYLKDERILG
jgi:hypothetical protein